MGQLRVTEAFAVFSAGTPHGDVYPAGMLVDAKDPVVKGREASFEPAEDAAARVVRSTSIERATAAPGEKRDVTPKPAKKAAAKKTAPKKS